MLEWNVVLGCLECSFILIKNIIRLSLIRMDSVMYDREGAMLIIVCICVRLMTTEREEIILIAVILSSLLNSNNNIKSFQ